MGGVHALAHPLGGVFDKHHGLLNAILMPYVMVKNRHAIAERMELLARVLELPVTTNGFDAVYSWVLELRAALNIPHTLAALEIPVDQCEAIGEMAVNDPSAGGNPVALSAADYAAICHAAITGAALDVKVAA